MTATYFSSLETLADTATPSGTWWLAVARALDELDERLAQDSAVDDGPSGAFRDAVGRAPALANEATRLTADRLRLVERARRLRRVVAMVAGDHSHADAVSGELEVLARAESRYRRRSRGLFWESFTRDIGGE